MAQLEQALYRHIVLAAFFYRVQTVTQSADQRRTAAAIAEQIILQIRVARHHPDIPQHFVQHACRAAGTALVAQLVDDVPRLVAQQANNNLAVGEGGVVIRNFTQTNGHGRYLGKSSQSFYRIARICSTPTRRGASCCSSLGVFRINGSLFFYSMDNTFATVSPIDEGVGQMVTPNSFSKATFSAALSPADEMIAPACPMRLPCGAVKPAM